MSTLGFKLLYFYLPYIYGMTGRTDFCFVGGYSVTRISLVNVPPPDQIKSTPNLIGSVYGDPIEQVVTSSLPITGFVYDMGTSYINDGVPCACDVSNVSQACEFPNEMAMYYHALPNISGVRVYV